MLGTIEFARVERDRLVLSSRAKVRRAAGHSSRSFSLRTLVFRPRVDGGIAPSVEADIGCLVRHEDDYVTS